MKRRSVLLATACLWAAARLPAAGAESSPSTPAGTEIPPLQVNLLVLIYDPVLRTKGGERLHAHMKWSDPRALTAKLIEDLREASHGYVNGRVVDTIEFDGFPARRDGFAYDEATYLQILAGDKDKARPGMTSFRRMYEQFGIEKRIREKNIAEIWLWGAPGFEWDELHWKIPGDRIPYQTDNPWFYRPYDMPDVGRTVWIMGFNYERGEGEALEDFCHRAESVLSLTVGRGVWDQKKNPDNPWVRFCRVDKDAPGQAEVGTTHYAPNSVSDYDWENRTPVPTYADDWLTYPDLPRKRKILNAETGGWKGMTAHHLWWLRHLPRRGGVTDGFHNNWWQYIFNYDEAVRTQPPPGATFEKARTAMYGAE